MWQEVNIHMLYIPPGLMYYPCCVLILCNTVLVLVCEWPFKHIIITHLESIPYPDNHQTSFRVSNKHTVHQPLSSLWVMWHHMIRDSTHSNANSVQLSVGQLIDTESSQPCYGSDLSRRVKRGWLLRFQWLIMARTSACKLKMLESVKQKVWVEFNFIGHWWLLSTCLYLIWTNEVLLAENG